MISLPIPIDPVLLFYIAEALDAVPERLYDFQKLKTLYVRNGLPFHKHSDLACDSAPKQLLIEPGNFSILGQMPRLKNLSIAVQQIKVFPKLSNCTVLEKLSLEGVPSGFDCAELAALSQLKSLQLHSYGTPANLAQLRCLKKLQRLSLACEKFEDLSFLEQLNSLRSLKIKGHGVFDCGIFNHLPDLKEAEFVGEIRLKHFESVDQARIKLTAPPIQKKYLVHEKKPVGWGVPIPFQFPREVENCPVGYIPASLSSPQWDKYTGAYGSIRGRLEKLMLRDEEFEYYLERLNDDLCHQMSFYPGTYLAVPHLAMLLREAWAEKNTLRQYQLIKSIGIILATDTPLARNTSPHIVPDEIAAKYESAVEDIRLYTRAALATTLAVTSVWDAEEKMELATATIAIFGDSLIAWMLTLLGWNECNVICPKCSHLNEGIRLSGKNTLVMPAPIPTGWNGKNMENTYLWVHNLLQQLKAYKAAKLISYYFGTYHCSACGAETPLMDGLKCCFKES